MFERFTDRARKLMTVANQEAHRFGDSSINCLYLLNALAKMCDRQEGGVAESMLDRMGVDPRHIRLAVESRITVQTDSNDFHIGKLPLTLGVENAIKQAIGEAEALGCNYVGTEHLLIALAEAPLAAEIFHAAGLTAKAFRMAWKQLHGDLESEAALRQLMQSAKNKDQDGRSEWLRQLTDVVQNALPIVSRTAAAMAARAALTHMFGWATEAQESAAAAQPAEKPKDGQPWVYYKGAWRCPGTVQDEEMCRGIMAMLSAEHNKETRACYEKRLDELSNSIVLNDGQGSEIRMTGGNITFDFVGRVPDNPPMFGIQMVTTGRFQADPHMPDELRSYPVVRASVFLDETQRPSIPSAVVEEKSVGDPCSVCGKPATVRCSVCELNQGVVPLCPDCMCPETH